MAEKRSESKRGEISYDRLIKACLRDHYGDIVTWLARKRPLEVRTLDTHIATTMERIGDKLLEARFQDGSRLLLHVEFQLKGSRGIGKRMVQFAALVLDLLDRPEHHSKDFLSVVVYLDQRTYREDPGFLHRRLSPGHSLAYSYTVMKLWEEDPEPLLAMNVPGVWPLLPLMRGDPLDLLRKSREKIMNLPGTMASLEDKQQLLTILGGLTWRVVKNRELLRSLLTELRNMSGNEFLDALWADRRAQVREEGRQAGRQEGRQEGASAEAREVILRILCRRFGEIRRELRDRLATTDDLATLEKLVEEAAVSPDLETFLALYLPPSR